MCFLTMSDTDGAVQTMLQIFNLESRGIVLLCSENKGDDQLRSICSDNKGADQLCSYCEADLRLCFGLCLLLVFSRRGSCGNSFH